MTGRGQLWSNPGHIWSHLYRYQIVRHQHENSVQYGLNFEKIQHKFSNHAIDSRYKGYCERRLFEYLCDKVF